MGAYRRYILVLVLVKIGLHNKYVNYQIFHQNFAENSIVDRVEMKQEYELTSISMNFQKISDG